MTPLERLKLAHSQLNETEKTADFTLQELQRQKTLLQKGDKNITQTQTEQSKANKFLNRMKTWWRW